GGSRPGTRTWSPRRRGGPRRTRCSTGTGPATPRRRGVSRSRRGSGTGRSSFLSLQFSGGRLGTAVDRGAQGGDDAVEDVRRRRHRWAFLAAPDRLRAGLQEGDALGRPGFAVEGPLDVLRAAEVALGLAGQAGHR